MLSITTTYCVELNGKDLLCCSNKIQAVTSKNVHMIYNHFKHKKIITELNHIVNLPVTRTY